MSDEYHDAWSSAARQSTLVALAFTVNEKPQVGAFTEPISSVT
jgi:hypothetical protein